MKFQAVVDTVMERHTQYRYAAVPREKARELLDACWFEKMSGDKIRGIGHAEGYVYPWNVIDYLILQEDADEKAKGSCAST